MVGSTRIIALALCAPVLAAAATPALARITRIEVAKVESAFNGETFGDIGAYERVTGKAYGEVDPRDPANSIIQDIRLAPVNARGMVEYVTDVDILRPKDPAKANGVLFLEIINRGRKLSFTYFHLGAGGTEAELNALAKPGDGFMMRKGYTIAWLGWQADMMPGAGRLMLEVPVALNKDGSPITGAVRAEFAPQAEAKVQNLSSGWFTGTNHRSYPTVEADNRKPLADGVLPTLTVRGKEQEPREPIPNAQWSFGNCADGGAVQPNDTQVCLPTGFKPGKLYELLYRAKDPLVLGLGYAAVRDLGSFLKYEQKDEKGTANPVFRKDTRAIVMGASQSGRFIRSYLHLGFNHGEHGEQVFDGALPHIGGGLMPLNIRFGQPGRAWGQQVDHLYPAYEFPFSYARQTDPLTGRRQGLLDRCKVSKTCPLMFHTATALEIWEGRQSLGLTDPLGTRDVKDPPNVRTFILASTQHGAAALPLPTAEPFGQCQQQSTPNPHTYTMRALLSSLTSWVRDGVPPPDSIVPRIADGTLVAVDQVRFPNIPANSYGNVRRPAMRFIGQTNPLHPLDFGPQFLSGEQTGVITREPPIPSTKTYGVLVTQADADGNDLGGVRSLFQRVPIGTYTPWNLFRKDRFEDGFCNFSGSFIPFARTKQERLDTGDARLSIEERYPTKEAYVEAVTSAAAALLAQRTLLKEDADRLIEQARGEGVRLAP